MFRCAVISIRSGLFALGLGAAWCGAVPPVGAVEWRITTVAGTGAETDNGRAGLAKTVNIGQPFGVEIGPDEALYITEVANHRVWRLDRQTGDLKVIAGTGRKGYSGDGGLATDADMNEPYEIRFDAAGNLFVVEMRNHVVRRIDAQTGRISTVAGTGEEGFSGDGGPAAQARLKVPHGIVLDGTGGLFIADIGNNRIRRVDLQTGTIETFAGTGQPGMVRSGARADESPLPGPRALATREGALWVVLREGHAVWRIDLKTRVLQHFGGTGKAGYTGDGGPAREATFNGPKGLAVDARGRLYIVDSENDCVRVLDSSTGLVETIAGRGKARRFSGDDGPARQAELSQPHGICLDREGTVYIGDTLNHRVRQIRPVR